MNFGAPKVSISLGLGVPEGCVSMNNEVLTFPTELYPIGNDLDTLFNGGTLMILLLGSPSVTVNDLVVILCSMLPSNTLLLLPLPLAATPPKSNNSPEKTWKGIVAEVIPELSSLIGNIQPSGNANMGWRNAQLLL